MCQEGTIQNSGVIATGSKGFHLRVPIVPEHGFDEVDRAGRAAAGLVVAALARAGIVSPVENVPHVGAIVHPATSAGAEQETQGPEGQR